MEVIICESLGRDGGYGSLRELRGILPICVLHAPFSPLGDWGDRIETLINTVGLAREISVPMVNFHPPKWLGGEVGFWRWMYAVRDFQRELGEGEVTVTVENMPCKDGLLRFNPYILRRTRDMARFIEERNLYLTFDCSHMGTTKADFQGNFLRFYKTKRIKNIHFSDFRDRREHLFPGRGILPLQGLLDFLRESGYDGMITLEIIPQELPEDEEAIKRVLGEVVASLRGESSGLTLEPWMKFDTMRFEGTIGTC
jgi:sugar phosphate isomerase/epimerase